MSNADTERARRSAAHGTWRALAALPHKYRQIILLRDLEELTIVEIARRLAISGEAAKSRLR